MAAFLIYTVTLLLTLLTRYLAGRWRWGYWLGGLIFGLFNEICFEFCWTYDPKMGIMLWRDVPLIVLAGWGSMTLLALTLSDRLADKMQWQRWRGLLDTALFVIIGFSAEWWLYFHGCWAYNPELHTRTVIQIAFYAGAGLLVSALGRRLEAWTSSFKK